MQGEIVLRSPRKFLGRIRRSFQLERYDVFTRAVPLEPEFVAPPGYVFDWGTEQDVDACRPFHTELNAYERRTGKARLRSGHGIVVGLFDGEVVFSMWVNTRNLNVPGLVKRRLSPEQWFIYKAFTSPEHRGRGLYEAGMEFVLDEMGRQGLRELVGYAHTKKSISRKGLARLRFSCAGPIHTLQVPGLRRIFVSKQLEASFPDSEPQSSTKVRRAS
jgi:predicted GNAT family acetyltransferase